MKKEDVIMWDWQRILFGEAPAMFMIEVFLRTIFSFILLITILRLLGNKMKGQLTLMEMAVIITLGAIISVPMQMPDRGIVVGIIALACILGFHRLMGWMTVGSSRMETIIQGKLSILVRDGVLDLEAMAASGMSKQQLFAELRGRSYYNLAKIKRVYFEASGIINVYPQDHRKPGLAVYPPGESELIDSSDQSHDHVACQNCGFVVETDQQGNECPHCNEKQWMVAIF
jgi:uncharacterized membrane protein YcaP (DUF421 family)